MTNRSNKVRCLSKVHYNESNMGLLVLVVLNVVLILAFTRASLHSLIYSGAAKLSPVYRDEIKMSVISWNMAEKVPNARDTSFLRTFNSSDIVVFGIQECEDIRPRRREGHRTRRWRELQRKVLGKEFGCLASHKMGGMFISIYMKKKAMNKVQCVQLVDVACGVGNVLTNKGAVGALLRINNKTIALINSHLAAHQKYVRNPCIDVYVHYMIYCVIEIFHASIFRLNSEMLIIIE